MSASLATEQVPQISHQHILFNQNGEAMSRVAIPAKANPKAIVVGERVYILEQGRFVLVESFRL